MWWPVLRRPSSLVAVSPYNSMTVRGFRGSMCCYMCSIGGLTGNSVSFVVEWVRWVSVIKRVDACEFVRKGGFVCWWMLLGPALGRGRVGRVSCVVICVDVCMVWLGKKMSACVGFWHARRMPGRSMCRRRMECMYEILPAAFAIIILSNEHYVARKRETLIESMYGVLV